MVTLHEMTVAEFQTFLEADIPAYAAEKVRAGNWTALRLRSARASTALSARGSRTAWHPERSRRVPVMSCRGGAGLPYNIFVEGAFRRRGNAAEAMARLEEESADLGLTGLALHLCGTNLSARALCAKPGYPVTNLNMAGPIQPQGSAR